MTDAAPEDELAEDSVSDAPDPEEYDAEGDSAVSGDTGTVYEGVEGDRAPQATPHDDELVDEDE